MPSAGPRTRAAQLLSLVALALAFSVQLVAAILPHVPALIVGTSAGLVIDLYVQHRQPALAALLSKTRLDATVRQQLRDTLTLIALLRIDGIDPTGEQFPLLALLLGFYLVHFVCQALVILVRRSRTLPVVTRNIDASGLRLSPAPPKLLRRPAYRLLRFSVPATAGLMATAGTQDATWGVLGLSLSLALALGGAAWLGTWLLPGRRPANSAEALEWLNGWLAEYQPTVGMYFSGGQTSAYQANMWLSTLAALDGKPLIVLRERFMVQKIDATDIPIVCIPKAAHVLNLEQSTLQVMLHPSNSGKTSQVLRVPTIKHAFINHGESDKLSSCNPYAKAYDEVWVAGPAARQRYALADVGVQDQDVVEVGRPQLSPIEAYRGAPADGEMTTVLYAPTWEGWTDDPGNTSVILAGENLVRQLLDDPGVRLLYKPHPLTGSVDPRAAQANERIKAMIAEANHQRSADPANAQVGPEKQQVLERRTQELAEVTAVAFRSSADELERMAVQCRPDPERSAALQVATRNWEEAYWASLPEWEHQVISGSRPALYSCFNQSHLLISDVSSVVSDYLASEKPYAVANTSGLEEQQFRERFPTVRAATLLDPSGDGIPELLESVRVPAMDHLAAARAELKTYLLGPAEPRSLERFNEAVLALAAKADERRLRMAVRLAAGSDLPPQREEVLSEAGATTAHGDPAEPAPSSPAPTPSGPRGSAGDVPPVAVASVANDAGEPVDAAAAGEPAAEGVAEPAVEGARAESPQPGGGTPTTVRVA
ncbi:hypothetical protein AQ490_10800 [Wenjunlia vitaminophila]|uniref:Integral membrane protein n=1 Tax=Wenjunlia vitaminophila TaxID=76728 RepID=A0A0T6LK11_WENVI|nr:hypothetical protein [Wenjunlia vitaminophila]KRV46398.1 hypothetical protein AQ490_10800 [Wenjunlia vitaminophila]